MAGAGKPDFAETYLQEVKQLAHAFSVEQVLTTSFTVIVHTKRHSVKFCKEKLIEKKEGGIVKIKFKYIKNRNKINKYQL